MDSYMTITAHYITDTRELKSRVLRTTIMPERHNAVNIAQRLKETIEEWDLVVFCTIHDNASIMNLAMELCEQFPHHLGCAETSVRPAGIQRSLCLSDCMSRDSRCRPTKVGIRRSLAMRECQWELVAQLIPVLRPLAKATTIMCGETTSGCPSSTRSY
ncbi:Zinc finger BED domain containing protein 1 [Dissostichus eleginoides]|uniref:Zinc finger BED domain containing protein 1 n=1 Tax=Dissostichus eleginoides TaxID=100907 RepID=A0AAD9CSP1_DISEL|nr:Zinc finger BED domain containing protein 1 [Dissostichus eleginoides]